MTKSELNKRLIKVGHHFRFVLTGIKCAILGAATFTLLVMSIWGFTVVAGQAGYAAVSDFILACTMLAGSVACLYLLGRPTKRGGGRYVEK